MKNNIYFFFKWLTFHAMILFLRLIRWLAEEGIEELQRHLRRPQVRRTPVQTQYKQVKKVSEPKVIEETGAIEWGTESVKDTQLKYFKELAKKNKW